MKRIVYHITQRRVDGRLIWQAKVQGAALPFFTHRKKMVVVTKTMRHARNLWYGNQQLTQIVIHLGRKYKNRIQFERTYGRDPRKYKG